MKEKQLTQMGITSTAACAAARTCIRHAECEGLTGKQILKGLRQTVRNPMSRIGDPFFAPLAEILAHRKGPCVAATPNVGAPWKQWGRNLDPKAVDQMVHACTLPVAVRGALMPDAHVGYGLPIGGVLATDNAVIPYAVGVDIACRMKLTVLDLPTEALDDKRAETLRSAIETETRFGIGAAFKPRLNHEVMDRDWGGSPVTRGLKDKAWNQLGTSGSGNHFVEFGVLHVHDERLGPTPGRYLALLSHSGSRGAGAEICKHYSRLAQSQCRGLTSELRHLAWLDMESAEGREYWTAMELMGRYAAANHELIHRRIARRLGAGVLLDIENHHNFAWKERHDGRDVIVHRKGATPAAQGLIGVIPGSMATPAYVVRGKGNPDSLESASHGAGRVMSRTEAKRKLSWSDAMRSIAAHKVTLISAGLDEVPAVYKDIDAVMASQADLAEILARFDPRLVKMAAAGERPED